MARWSLPVIALASAVALAAPGMSVGRVEAGKGYTLFAPLQSATTYLIDRQGNVVHTWPSEYAPGQAAYLLENGNLLRCAQVPGNSSFHGGGIGGRVEEIDWDGSVVWEYTYANEHVCLHHDIEPLPNGNILMIAWERKTADEAADAGLDPALLSAGEVWADHVIEVRPERPRGGTVVWAWHVWDHLVQEHDAAKANYGVVADHPELIDINYGGSVAPVPPEDWQRLRGLGYVGGRPPRSRPGGRLGGADWNHTNSIAYNPQLDQIVLSVLGSNEIWVIDHSTTTGQAAGHTGGRGGRGGDLLYRWGNPRAYQAGTAEQQQLFAQHDARWIAPGQPGAGNLLVFNNGRGRPDGNYSSVDEIVVPVNTEGQYTLVRGEAYGPLEPAWRYVARQKSSFFSGHISGAQRLPSGNTLICSGEQGLLFEVTPDGRTVWEYENPFGGDVAPEGPPGGGPRGAGPRRRGPPSRDGGDPPPRGDRRRGSGGERTAVFRAVRIAPDFPGLSGRTLTPIRPDAAGAAENKEPGKAP